MTTQISSETVWAAIEKELFAVLGMVTREGEARTVGIVYIVRDHKLYIGTNTDAWKTRHVKGNPHVSITIPIAKRIPLLPWIKIPAATITCSGTARVIAGAEAPREILQAIFRGMAEDEQRVSESSLIEITPQKEFITYGVGIPLMQMRDPNLARGRVAVS